MKPSLRRAVLVALLVVAAALRVYWVSKPRVVWGDETFYLWVGQSLLDGHGYQFFGYSGSHFSPLFPLLVGLIAKLAGGFTANSTQALIASSGIVYVVSGTLLVLPVYDIARRIAGTGPGLAAALVAAVYPMLTAGALFWSTGTEVLYLCLLAVGWWGLLVGLEDDRLWGFALAGAMIALAYLVRTEGLVFLVAGTAAVFLLRLTQGPAHRLRRALTLAPAQAGRCSAGVGAGVVVLIFFVLISPYLVLQWRQTGEFQLTEEAGFAYTSMQGLAERDMTLFDRATWGLDPASGEVYLFAPVSAEQGFLAAIVTDPIGFARRLRLNFFSLLDTTFSVSLIPWPLAALAVLGLFSRPWSARRGRGELLLMAFLAGPFSFLLFDVQARYLSGVLLPALVWIGEGVAQAGEWLGETWQRMAADKRMQRMGSGGAGGQGSRGAEVLPGSSALLLALPALALAVALLWQTPRVWEMMHWTRSFQPAHLAAAAELRALGVSAEAVVMSRYPAIAFHAGTRWAPTPDAPWPEVIAYARKHGARYLAMDAVEGTLRPQLSFLLDPSQAPAELRYVATADAGADPVVIYEFVASP